MILIPIAFFLIGLAISIQFHLHGYGAGARYLAVACLAGLDTVLGGIRSGYEGKFQNDVFITGFITNTIISFVIAFIGDRIGIELLVVVALVMGMRIFNNLSLIRRYLLQGYTDMVSRRKRQAIEASAQKEISQTGAMSVAEGVE